MSDSVPDRLEAFNRTSLELKQAFYNRLEQRGIAFNRTSLELKPLANENEKVSFPQVG